MTVTSTLRSGRGHLSSAGRLSCYALEIEGGVHFDSPFVAFRVATLPCGSGRGASCWSAANLSHSAVVGRREPRPECVNVTPPPALEILITGTVIVDVGLIVEVVDDCDPFNVVGRRLWRSCSGVASDSTGIATITAANAGEWSSAEYHRDGSSGPALGGVSSLVMRVRMPASGGD